MTEETYITFYRCTNSSLIIMKITDNKMCTFCNSHEHWHTYFRNVIKFSHFFNTREIIYKIWYFYVLKYLFLALRKQILNSTYVFSNEKIHLFVKKKKHSTFMHWFPNMFTISLGYIQKNTNMSEKENNRWLIVRTLINKIYYQWRSIFNPIIKRKIFFCLFCQIFFLLETNKI